MLLQFCKFTDLPLQFVYFESCHHKFTTLRSIPLLIPSMYFLKFMDKSTPIFFLLSSPLSFVPLLSSPDSTTCKNAAKVLSLKGSASPYCRHVISVVQAWSNRTNNERTLTDTDGSTYLNEHHIDHCHPCPVPIFPCETIAINKFSIMNEHHIDFYRLN